MNFIDQLQNKRLQQYEFEKLVGKGTFGEVYKAYDNDLLRSVAVKVFTPKSYKDFNFDNEDIIQEARFLARAEHANIVPVYNLMDFSDSTLIVMRFLYGKTLENVINTLKSPLNLQQTASVMLKVLSGMGYAHSRGIVHQDIKPANIFISVSEEIFILDFGIATLTEEQRILKGQLFGTPSYMSPEQMQCSYIDCRSDIYCIGLIFYLLLTGTHPFGYCKTIDALIDGHKNQDPKPVSDINKNLPTELNAILDKAMRKNPKERYSNCWEFASDVEKLLGIENGRIYEMNLEKRWDNRAKTNLHAKIQFEDNEQLYHTVLVDLSVGGAKIEIDYEITLPKYIAIYFTLMNNNEEYSITARAMVRRIVPSRSGSGFFLGLKFENLTDHELYQISLFVRNSILMEHDNLQQEATVKLRKESNTLKI